MRNFISILTPTHNRSKWLAECIQSVQRQAGSGFSYEHIIIDNASTDDTAKVVRALAKADKRIRYVYNPRNLGAADALNAGFKKSKGGLIVPVDDDDLLPRYSLKFRFDFFKKNPQVKWAYGHIAFIDRRGKLWKNLLEYNLEYTFKKSFLHSLLLRNFIPGGSVTVRRECIKKVGGWDPQMKAQDYDMSLRLAAARYVPHKMDSYLYYYRLHGKQSHRSHMKDGTFKEEREKHAARYGSDAKALKGR